MRTIALVAVATLLGTFTASAQSWWLRKILQGKAMCDDCAERHELLHAAVRPQLRDDQSEEKEVTRTRELAA